MARGVSARDDRWAEVTPVRRTKVSGPRGSLHFDTLKGQLDLRSHGGNTWAATLIRVLQRLVALTAAAWHATITPTMPSGDPCPPTTTDP